MLKGKPAMGQGLRDVGCPAARKKSQKIRAPDVRFVRFVPL
jgi:hypothetical protein